ncbi:hypothetical protein FOA43_003312 [Brettanomyces nanus]|uniref:SWR1-complex protein 4 n=1 Tax=Eeniella nana TaxID=13502 RepID=A0A875S3M6_EENNA|nr:uncharacterized protein FOA43_003312 [Brettanomyces nanus]QPG75926.1 hypothetical protein FOA43_003312 [Brettanomyces nanus]
MASDILDVLNISEETRVQGKELKQQQKHEREETVEANNKKRKMNRELFNLIGPNLPPVALHKQSVKFKDKLSSQELTHWSWRSFKNGARGKDKLVLHHWIKSKVKTTEEDTVKDDDDLEENYQFEKYNTELDIPDFTEEYYNEHLKDLDGNWSYNETRYLFDIAKSYDLRWAVIGDNYEFVKEIPENKEEKEERENGGSDANQEIDKDTNEEAIKDKIEENDDEAVAKPGPTEESSLEDADGSENENAKGESEVAEKQDQDDDKADDGKENAAKITEEVSESTKASESPKNETQKEASEALGQKKDTSSSEGRTLEDLKDRLYKVSAVILESQSDAAKDATLIRNLKAFDKNKEMERRSYLTHLLERAPTEIAEEESLVIEARKLELAAKKMLTERAQLLQLLDSPQASASVQKYMTSAGLTQLYNSLMNADKSKKRKPEAPVAPQLGPNALPHTQLLQARQQQANHGALLKTKKKHRSNSPTSRLDNNGGNNEIQELLQSRLTPEQMEVYGITVHEEKIQPGVVIRSQKLPSFKPAVQSKINETLNEMGIAVRPVMPTAKVCSRFDRLLRSIASLIDLKKQSDNLETEIGLIKRQKNIN